MDAPQMQRLKPALVSYLRELDDCFGRSEPAGHLRTYVSGQLSDLLRKSMEPIADAAGSRPRDLQNFRATHQWDAPRMRETVAQLVARDHAPRGSIGIIDETAHPTKGTKTPGVQRQWCGNTGKKDNCVVTVHLGYAAGDFHGLLDGELFLPEAWSEDRQRCAAARIPGTCGTRAPCTLGERPPSRGAQAWADASVCRSTRFRPATMARTAAWSMFVSTPTP